MKSQNTPLIDHHTPGVPPLLGKNLFEEQTKQNKPGFFSKGRKIQSSSAPAPEEQSLVQILNSRQRQIDLFDLYQTSLESRVNELIALQEIITNKKFSNLSQFIKDFKNALNHKTAPAITIAASTIIFALFIFSVIPYAEPGAEGAEILPYQLSSQALNRLLGAISSVSLNLILNYYFGNKFLCGPLSKIIETILKSETIASLRKNWRSLIVKGLPIAMLALLGSSALNALAVSEFIKISILTIFILTGEILANICQSLEPAYFIKDHLSAFYKKTYTTVFPSQTALEKAETQRILIFKLIKKAELTQLKFHIYQIQRILQKNRRNSSPTITEQLNLIYQLLNDEKIADKELALQYLIFKLVKKQNTSSLPEWLFKIICQITTTPILSTTGIYGYYLNTAQVVGSLLNIESIVGQLASGFIAFFLFFLLVILLSKDVVNTFASKIYYLLVNGAKSWWKSSSTFSWLKSLWQKGFLPILELPLDYQQHPISLIISLIALVILSYWSTGTSLLLNYQMLAYYIKAIMGTSLYSLSLFESIFTSTLLPAVISTMIFNCFGVPDITTSLARFLTKYKGTELHQNEIKLIEYLDLTFDQLNQATPEQCAERHFEISAFINPYTSNKEDFNNTLLSRKFSPEDLDKIKQEIAKLSNICDYLAREQFSSAEATPAEVIFESEDKLKTLIKTIENATTSLNKKLNPQATSSNSFFSHPRAYLGNKIASARNYLSNAGDYAYNWSSCFFCCPQEEITVDDQLALHNGPKN